MCARRLWLATFLAFAACLAPTLAGAATYDNEATIANAQAFTGNQQIVSTHDILFALNKQGAACSYIATQPGTLEFQTLLNGTWTTFDQRSITANTGDRVTFYGHLRTFRVRYTNTNNTAGTLTAAVWATG